MKYEELKNRIGWFAFSVAVLEAVPDDIMFVLGKCVITKAEYVWHEKCIKYWGMSPLFDKLPEGNVPPMYTFEIKATAPDWERKIEVVKQC